MTLVPRIEIQGCGCDSPEQLARLVSIDEALRRIAQRALPVDGIESLPLPSARGRILAEAVRATAMTPPFDNAAMDGYAVDTAAFAGEGPWTFPVSGRVPAGHLPSAAIGGGSVARIFTGAPVPPGMDAVIRQEDTRRKGDLVSFLRRPEPGLNIRLAGSDMMPGDPVAEAGARLGPREIAACAAAGAGTVRVRRSLRVGVLVTGDEVRAAGTGRSGAEIWDVNTPMICALLGVPGIEIVQAVQVADNPGALERGLSAMVGHADLIVTTGGVSVGEEDHVRPALARLGAELHFSGIAIKPGKPVSYGSIGGTHWLGLPGNPLSAFVTWQVFGQALVRRLTGRRLPVAPRRNVVTGQPIRRKPGRCELRPASLAGFDGQGREVVAFDDATHSGRVGLLPRCDGLMLLPAECDHLPAGALVEFLPFCDT